MQNIFEHDGVYVLLDLRPDYIVTTALRVDRPTDSFAQGRRVLWAIQGPTGGGPQTTSYPSHLTTAQIIKKCSDESLTKSKRSKKGPMYPLAFVDNIAIKLFKSKDDVVHQDLVNKVSGASTDAALGIHNPELQIVSITEVLMEDVIANDPDIQAIRDLVTRLGRKTE